MAVKAKAQVMRCLECAQEIRFGPRGWTHAGGGAYLMECRSCFWRGSRPDTQWPPWRCPCCRQVGTLRDLHCAIPAAVAEE